MYYVFMFTRLLANAADKVADVIVGTLDTTGIGTSERRQAEVHTWTPTYREDPL